MTEYPKTDDESGNFLNSTEHISFISVGLFWNEKGHHSLSE
jgi:hypothetical protein